jgi:hypothetical protein
MSKLVEREVNEATFELIREAYDKFKEALLLTERWYAGKDMSDDVVNREEYLQYWMEDIKTRWLDRLQNTLANQGSFLPFKIAPGRRRN